MFYICGIMQKYCCNITPIKLLPVAGIISKVINSQEKIHGTKTKIRHRRLAWSHC